MKPLYERIGGTHCRKEGYFVLSHEQPNKGACLFGEGVIRRAIRVQTAGGPI